MLTISSLNFVLYDAMQATKTCYQYESYHISDILQLKNMLDLIVIGRTQLSTTRCIQRMQNGGDGYAVSCD